VIRPILLALVGALCASAGLAPVGSPILMVVGLALFLTGVLQASGKGVAFFAGFVYGVAFTSVVMEWLTNLASEAAIGLGLLQGLFYGTAAASIWMLRKNSTGSLAIMLVAILTAMDFARERIPFGGVNWGAPGYSFGEWTWLRSSAQWIGTSGLSVVAVAVASGVALSVVRREHRPLIWAVGFGVVAATLGAAFPTGPTGPELTVAIVQGNSPCPGSRCENERGLIFESHLAMTKTLPTDTYDLVVWPESSTGFGFDPLQSSEVAKDLAAEAERLGAYLMVGGDRADTPGTFINSNLLYNRSGDLIGEYRKRHPVPFGEYIPFRSILGQMDLFSRVPRDMVRGVEPGVFVVDFGSIGTVISSEAAFARYSRDAASRGAGLLVVASNEASYGRSVAAEQFIDMSRMRAAENGFDVVHGAVTGSSVLITDGGVLGEVTALYEPAIVTGTVRVRSAGPTLFARWGDWLAVGIMVLGGWLIVEVAVRSGAPKRREATQG
jgi:apolipoprotein N-acyltransferase